MLAGQEACTGIAPLTARLEPWQQELLADPETLERALEAYGSPVNVVNPSPLTRNGDELHDAAARHGVDLKIFFARKANKCLAFVDAASLRGHGVDVASERELRQALQRGVPASDLVVTAAVKPAPLLALCVASGATVVIDNEDELHLLTKLAAAADASVPVAFRMAPDLGPERLTRFGLTPDEILAVVQDHWPAARQLQITGVHFHIGGYDAAARVSAAEEALALTDALTALGHEPSFIDIGGGIPISYLDSADEWDHFWAEHRRGLAGERDMLTFEDHELGNVYPYFQEPVRGDWLDAVLAATMSAGETVAHAFRRRALQLRCEPGRALVDGCGVTAARVEFRKQRADGTWLIGVAMNRTQCRSTSDDFLVDPLLLSTGDEDADSTGPIEGFLVGAYCIERELLTWRRLRFPNGVRVGDIVVFPNTAGYLMHILESASHQIPLARNLVYDGPERLSLDRIDVIED